MEADNTEGRTPPAGGQSPAPGPVTQTGKELTQEMRKAGQAAVTRVVKAGQAAATKVARAGKTAREFGAGVQKQVKRVQKDLAPAAAKARKGLQQARQGLGKALQATGRATRKSARILKLNAQIGAAMRKRQKLYAQIGEAYFKLQRRKGTTPIGDLALAELVEGAEAANREIRQLEARVRSERAPS